MEVCVMCSVKQFPFGHHKMHFEVPPLSLKNTLQANSASNRIGFVNDVLFTCADINMES